MWKQLDDIQEQYEKLERRLQDHHLIQKKDQYHQIVSQFSKLKTPVELYKEYKKLKTTLENNQKIATEDSELLCLVQEENQIIEKKIQNIKQKLEDYFTTQSTDPLDEKNIILEIRAGAGGDEASLFCRELFEAYSKYASFHNWKIETLSCSYLPTGGFREMIARVFGQNVYKFLKYESGVHRVQRVPQTESQGRVHTSTVTVAVLPEAEKTEIHIKQEDIRIDVCRSSGAGGQHVNTTDSAVRIVHHPSNITVYCQEEKSQHANKEKAFKILYARLLSLQKEKQRKESSEMRLQQIGTGDRSQKIRTYNFPQSRVTDHRITLTLYALDRVMKGEFDILIYPLIKQNQELLKQGS